MTVTAVFDTVLRMSAAGSVVILVVLLARLLLKKAPKKYSYALWALAAFRLVCPVSIQGVFSIFRVKALRPIVEAPRLPVLHQGNTAPLVPPQEGVVPVLPVTPSPESVHASTAPSMGEIAAIIWILGMAALLIYTVVRYLRLKKQVASAIPNEAGIFETEHIGSPFILGFVHPRIYIPYGLPQEKLDLILAHERYHIRRRDHLLRPFGFLILIVHWFNPMCWLAFSLAGRDMEMSCDEGVLREREASKKVYSNTLLSFAEERSDILSGPLAFGETGVKIRIKNALRWKKPRIWVTAVSALLCVVLAVACTTDPAVNTPEDEDVAGEPTGEDHDLAPDLQGKYPTIGHRVMEILSTVPDTEVTYFAASGEEKTATVTDIKLYTQINEGELAGLAPEGVLEAWEFNYLVKLDVPIEDVRLVGGMIEKDGWLDLEGQGGHTVITLRYPDDSLDVLASFPINDGRPFYGFHETIQESLYDWYVTRENLDLPLAVEEIPDPDNEGSSLHFHRFDGDGWYIYIPVTAWVKVDTSAYDGWYSQYGSGSTLDINLFDQTAQSQVDHLLKNGWEKAGNDPAHIRKFVEEKGMEMEDYWFEAPDGGSIQIRIAWDPERVKEYPETAGEAELLRRMAESFTIDDRVERAPTPTPHWYLWDVEDGSPVELTLAGEEALHFEDFWGPNSLHYFQALANRDWISVEEPKNFASQGDSVTLTTASWTLTAWEGTPYSRRDMGGSSTWYTDGEGDVFDCIYDFLRSWLDEAEWDEIQRNNRITVADRGQSSIEAAEEWFQRYQELHLLPRSGSSYRYTLVETEVRPADGATESLRKNGEIGENTECFYLLTVFIPENERAAIWSQPGNTGPYIGDDPTLQGAYQHDRCCILTREDGVWQGEILGTGW